MGAGVQEPPGAFYSFIHAAAVHCYTVGDVVRHAGAGSGDMSSDMPPQFAASCPEGLSGSECFQVYIVNQFMVLFMMTL